LKCLCFCIILCFITICSYIFEWEKILPIFSLIEIKYLDSMSLCDREFLEIVGKNMSESFCTWMGSDDEFVHKYFRVKIWYGFFVIYKFRTLNHWSPSHRLIMMILMRMNLRSISVGILFTIFLPIHEPTNAIMRRIGMRWRYSLERNHCPK
jgi:hypothetical protein